MDVKKSLENRIRGWFPQEPKLRRFHAKGKITTVRLPPSTFECISIFSAGQINAAIWGFFAVMQLSYNLSNSVVFFALIFGLAAFQWAATLYRLYRWHLLNDNYLRFLFASTAVTIVAASILYAFTFLTSTSYWIISAVDISLFTALFALRRRVFTSKMINLNKRLITLFTVLGIVLLVFSMAQVSHVEAKLTPVGHSAAIVQAGFTLSHPIPDSEVVQNLTTADHVDFEIIVARLGPHQTEASGFSVQVMNQSASAPTSPYIFFYVNNVTNWASRSWHPWQNGTYYFRLHYDYVVPDQMDISIWYSWGTNETVPTRVYNPILSQFTTPAVAGSLALLALSVAIPAQQALGAWITRQKQSAPTSSTELKT